MDTTFDNGLRFSAIFEAINSIPHDQSSVGLGFQLRHNPGTCRKCRAQLAAFELQAFIQVLEMSDGIPHEEVFSGDD